MSPRQYGSISSDGDAAKESVELLGTHGENSTHIGTIVVSDHCSGRLKETKKWFPYALGALIGVVAIGYLHGRYPRVVDHVVPTDDRKANRVPMPQPLSSLDPASDLGFHSTKRSGLASPSKVWQQFAPDKEDQQQQLEYTKPLPTNAWYMNLLSHKAASDPSKAGEVAHVYTIPYIVGVSPPTPKNMPISATTTMAGIELFLPVMKTSSRNMQMVFDKYNGVSLGALIDEKKVKNIGEDDAATSYHVINDGSATSISPLGVSLRWNHLDMKTYIVRGMPYGTVAYGKDVLPTILAGNRPSSIIIDKDDSNKMQCGSLTGKPVEQDPKTKAPISNDGAAHTYTVEKELVFHLKQSDFTWVVFFSKPVKLRCFSDAIPVVSVAAPNEEVQFRVDVTEVISEEDDDEELVVRMAVASECTTGKSTMNEHCDNTLGYDTVSSNVEEYLELLRKGKDFYPKNPLIGMEFPAGDENDERVTNVVFDWDFTSTKVDTSTAADQASTSLRGVTPSNDNDDDALIMFALPHHLKSLSETDSSMCFHTFHGRTCIVHGSKWELPVDHGDPQSFLADRPPLADVIPDIAEALKEDVKFQFSSNVLRGAADTYFPAKIMSKIGRIIEIAHELKQLSDGDAPSYADADEATIAESASAAAAVDLPSDSEIESLLDGLQDSVEIWLRPGGKAEKGAEAEFLFDESWGGFVNCGCNYTFHKGSPDKGTCNNAFPSTCPALVDVNEDFGNGFYNDHHFHYGYHIYAAAVVAKYRPEWGKRMYERVLMYIRDVANPSVDDKYFPVFRQKDWYLGNSWAAGLMSMELSPHGREQESSSEAIAAFEGIALFGAAMMNAFKDDAEKFESARMVRNVGEFLTSMEVEAAKRYWHVYGEQEGTTTNSSLVKNSTVSTHINTYPSQYTKKVVGMMHDTMASFQTWFAPQDVVSYGIQLIPFTAVAQRRDDPEWTRELYPVYAESCETADMGNDQNSGFCVKNGWSVVQAGLLAETGKIDEAISMAKGIPKKVYSSEGASGHSATNTLWFISTRKIEEELGE
ncbi:hypothetical protein ACHAXM_005924 [Skeletonema potamos]